jgi:hypothetical protein
VFETVCRTDSEINPFSVARTVLQYLSISGTLALTKIASIFFFGGGGYGLLIGDRGGVGLRVGLIEKDVIWAFAVFVGPALVLATLSFLAGITTPRGRIAGNVE